MREAILKATDAHKEAILKTYEQLHALPEWGLEEYKTSAYIKEWLRDADIPTRELAATGLVAELVGDEPGPVVGLRVDIDALPFKNEAGETYYVHACGHDAHTAMGLWVLKVLKELNLVKRGQVRVIFQPAEERLVGARNMITAGAAAGLDELYGVHIRPVQEARLGQAAPALWQGGSTVAELTVTGKAAHGARPHLGVNAIDGATLAIMAINSIWANPTQQWSAKVTKITGGGVASNIIPDRAIFTVDMRAETDSVMDEIIEKVRVAGEGGALAVGGKAEMNILGAVPAAQYDQELINNLAVAITEVLGPEGLIPPIKSPGSDDFHEFKKADPRLKAAFLALGADATPGLHDPQMRLATDSLLIGTRILVFALAQRVRSGG